MLHAHIVRFDMMATVVLLKKKIGTKHNLDVPACQANSVGSMEHNHDAFPAPSLTSHQHISTCMRDIDYFYVMLNKNFFSKQAYCSLLSKLPRLLQQDQKHEQYHYMEAFC